MAKFRIPSITGIALCCLSFLLSGQAENFHDGPGGVSPREYASHSVLASGTWYKIAIAESGICRISFSELQAMGMNMDAIDPRNIRIYGNGGGMLPEGNATFRYDDLQENAVEVVGEEDGSFDAPDYILFYVKGPVEWNYNTAQKVWESWQNTYSDSAFYFITESLGKGKRIAYAPEVVALPTENVSSYDYRTYHEKDAVNLIKSGRSWYGELFDITTTHSFAFDIPNLIEGSKMYLKTSTAARATTNSRFMCTIGNTSWEITHYPISTYYNSPYASGTTSFQEINAPSSPVTLKMDYIKSTNVALGWLDAINLTARCDLKFLGGQLDFRDIASVGEGKIAQYTLSNTSGQTLIWEVTDPLNVRRVSTRTSGNDLVFTCASDTLREYIAFDESRFVAAQFVAKVPNQDLHAIHSADLVIVAPPVFYDQAVRLATYHATSDDLNSIVLSPDLIYNEFSSGSPDVIAIRDFMKMLYDRGAGTNKPRYLLLFGDGSYDNKNRLSGNTNFIPTWQTTESFDPVRSGVSDDYYGILDDKEGLSYSDPVDIGIGRFPVKTVEEAESMVDKVIHYSSKSEEVMGDWRNMIAFIADDEDGNEHVQQADNMSYFIKENYKDFNVDKIYMDAYLQVATTAGARYPEVNQAITQRVEKGCLILNYTGHGGETGWAHEQVLEIQDINAWNNYNRMPVFVTATCEFSRFDDPGRTSAGELVLLNKKGGGITLFTTTRPTYGSPNFELNTSFYKYALSFENGIRRRMGDIMKEAKRENGSDENGRKFILLGDPAIQIAYPELKVITSSINGHAPGAIPDTLKALEEVTITGMIADHTGALVSDFNGIVYPTVYDKATEQNTLGNDGGTLFHFSLQKNILYKGKVAVSQGLFNFTFVVPRDIAYRYDFGKLSYYATNGITDASGDSTQIIVGGSSDNVIADQEGPDISLFMNSESFRDGGITDENPWLIVKVSDENGINTIGSGIGHDITAILDGKSDEPSIMNDFYESDIDTYRSGIIRFPYSRLTAGEHSIAVKVWDIYGNSSQSTIHFVVYRSEEFVIEKASNFPNPFKDVTNLVFSHNQQGNEMTIKVDIYSVTGQLVRVLNRTSLEDGATSTPISWDGYNTSGSPVESGMYFYTITAKTSSGLQASTNGKLIYSK